MHYGGMWLVLHDVLTQLYSTCTVDYVIIYHKQSHCLLKYTEAIPKGISYTSHERLYSHLKGISCN